MKTILTGILSLLIFFGSVPTLIRDEYDGMEEIKKKKKERKRNFPKKVKKKKKGFFSKVFGSK